MDTSELAKRMKNMKQYQKRVNEKAPVILRLDGRAFHTFTRNFVKPFDQLLMEVMQATMKYLCENIQGCVIGYTQSDEITLVLTDYKNLHQKPGLIMKCRKCVVLQQVWQRWNLIVRCSSVWNLQKNVRQKYTKILDKGATFDCRAFNVPKEEVANNLYWRQLDAMRNSIQMLDRQISAIKNYSIKTAARLKRCY